MPIVDDSFIHELTLHGRLPLLGLQGRRQQLHHRHLQDRGRVRADPGRPLPRQLQPRGSRAEHRRAVLRPGRRPGRHDDPCAGDRSEHDCRTERTLAQCQNTGVTAAQYGNIPPNPANQYNWLLGGNPDLLPEKADTYTAGVVLQPRFIPGFAVTVDYFDIKVEEADRRDRVSTRSSTSASPLAIRCSAIASIRDAHGSLWLTPKGFIDRPTPTSAASAPRASTSRRPTLAQIGGMGSLNLKLRRHLADELITDRLGASSYDCTGFFGAQCGTPNPSGGTSSASASPSRTASASRASGATSRASRTTLEQRRRSANASPTSAQNFAGNAKIKRRATSTWRSPPGSGERYNFRLGANNILDTDPPIAGGEVMAAPFGNGNTYPQVYDALGRYIFAGVTVDF